jgi:tyrosine-protein kinase Etk/Wzc
VNEPFAPLNAAAAEKEFDVAAMLDVFVLYRRMMLWIFTVISVVGIAAVLLSDPQYQANIITQVDESSAASSASSLLGPDISSMFDVKSSASTEVQVLKSRLVAASVVDHLQLYIEAGPVRLPVIGRAMARSRKGLSTPGLLGMGGYVWSDEYVTVDRFDVPAALEGERYRLTALGDGAYRLSGAGIASDVSGRIGKTESYASDQGPIVLHVAAIRGAAGARFDLARQSRLQTIDRLQRDLAVSEQGKDSNVLQVKLRGTDPLLITTILNDVAHYYVSQNESRKAEQASRSLKFLRGRMPELREKLALAENAYAVVRRNLGSVDLAGEAKGILEQSADAQTRLGILQQKRAEALTLFLPGNPTVLALDGQIAELQAQSNGLDRRMDRLPDAQRQIVRAERDVRLNNDLYVGLLNNIEQLQILQAGRIANVRVLDTALLPDRPVRLWRPVLYTVVIAFAIFAALAAAFIRNLLFCGIADSHEIEAQTSLKVFSTVPRAMQPGFSWFRRGGHSGVAREPLAFADPDDPAIESLRSFRTALQFSLVDSGTNVVMFTGPSPNVGKSFIASNVAAVVASTGKRVLLIDGDLRLSGLSRTFGRASAVGLSDVIAGSCELDKSIVTIARSNLDFLPSGSLSANAADLLSQPVVGDLLRSLSARYDLVIVDTAPLLPVSDAAMLAPYCSGNIFLVARAAVTKPAELEECARRLRQVGVDVTGVVLNGIDRHAGRFRYGPTYGTYRYAHSGTGGAAR